MTALPAPHHDDVILADGTRVSRQSLEASIRRGHQQAIDDMVSNGTLSASGPITQNDVSAMIFMALSAQDMLDDLI